MRIEHCIGLATAAVAVVTGVAVAGPLTREQSKQLATQGYKTPSVVYAGTAFSIASAKLNGKRHLVILTASGKVMDAGPQETGKLMIEARAGSTHGSNLTLLEVGYRVPRANKGFEKWTSLWLVRADGSRACVVSGSGVSSSGTACGSSASTSATPRLTTDATGAIALDVRYEHSGNWSTPDGPRGCRHRSPTRSQRAQRWIIPASGTCNSRSTPIPSSSDPDF